MGFIAKSSVEAVNQLTIFYRNAHNLVKVSACCVFGEFFCAFDFVSCRPWPSNTLSFATTHRVIADFDSRVQTIESPEPRRRNSKASRTVSKRTSRRVSTSDLENYPPSPSDQDLTMANTRVSTQEKTKKTADKNKGNGTKKDKKIATLEKQLKAKEKALALANEVAAKKRGKRAHDKDDPNVKLIGEIVRKKLWRKCKFILSPKQEIAMSKLVLEHMGEKYQGDSEESKANRKGFMDMYSEVVTQKLNLARNYYASQLRKQCAWKYMKKNGSDALPPTEVFLKFIKRETAADEDEMAQFVWIWDKCLDVVNGGKHWKESGKFCQRRKNSGLF